MESDFDKFASECTDEKLVEITSINRNRFQLAIVIAADLEISKRGIDKTKIEELKGIINRRKEEESILEPKESAIWTRLLGLSRYLSIYLVTGITLVIATITIWAINMGGMAVFYIPFTILLFLPFMITSLFSMLDISKHKNAISFGIKLSMVLLVFPSYFLPLFYEGGGVLIATICTGIAVYVLFIKKDLKARILVVNMIGSFILTLLLILILTAMIFS
ncbi:MAG: hypothetical protein JKY53_04720 [Flavobacteriales bacterium]|nr:hypothetical protein [Flavobacteriales bacterium]